MGNEKESQVRRIPKKYWELIETLNNEDAGKLLKAIFSDNNKLEWILWVYFNILKVDLDNLEKSAMNWGKWWRPKKEKTTGYEKEKPPVMKSNNLKEKEIVKVKENIKEVIINNNTTDVVKKDNRDIEIDLIIETLKNCNWWILDDTIKKQRQYWKLIKDKILKIQWFNWDYVWFVSMLYEKSNTYQKQYFKSAEKFYYNIAWIIAWIRTIMQTENEKKPWLARC